MDLREDDDDAVWEGWNEDSSDSSSESEGWMDVEDDDNDLVISDSEDEAEKEKQRDEDGTVEQAKVSQLATTKVRLNDLGFITRKLTSLALKILTPADFALLNDLRLQAASKAAEGGSSSAKRKLAELVAIKSSNANQTDNAFISENDILGPQKKAKADYAERMASIQKGREGREKFGSSKGKQKKDTPSSSTNREKARNKPIMMILSSGAVRGKRRASLREKQQRLRAHIERGKKAWR